MQEDDEAAQRKKTDEQTPDVDVDDQEESSATEQDVEPNTADQPEPNIQQANRSSPRKRRTKADLDVSAVAIGAKLNQFPRPESLQPYTE